MNLWRGRVARQVDRRVAVPALLRVKQVALVLFFLFIAAHAALGATPSAARNFSGSPLVTWKAHDAGSSPTGTCSLVRKLTSMIATTGNSEFSSLIVLLPKEPFYEKEFFSLPVGVDPFAFEFEEACTLL